MRGYILLDAVAGLSIIALLFVALTRFEFAIHSYAPRVDRRASDLSRHYTWNEDDVLAASCRSQTSEYSRLLICQKAPLTDFPLSAEMPATIAILSRERP